MSLMELNRTGRYGLQRVPPEIQNLGEWLTVADAVVRCTERALPRTPKTIRKWAARSYLNPENADISVRREDTENGFRWSIEASSLDRKIDEELEFERRKLPNRDSTGAHQVAQVSAESSSSFLDEPTQEVSEPVRTGKDTNSNDRIEVELRAQLEQAHAEIDFLRGELTHRRQTDKALGTVIEAFKLNAEATRAQLVERNQHEPKYNGKVQRHDIVPGHQEFEQP